MARVVGHGLFHRRSGAPTEQEVPAETLTDPYAYAIDVRRDEAALGRFVKHLSVSGAEKIRVEVLDEHTVRVKMQRPVSEDAWEPTLTRLLDRCGLDRVDTPALPPPASARGKRTR